MNMSYYPWTQMKLSRIVQKLEPLDCSSGYSAVCVTSSLIPS